MTPCPNCGQPGGVILFLSIAPCDRCNTLSPSEEVAGVGFALDRHWPEGSHEYAFRTREDAEKWRAAAGLTMYPIRQIKLAGALHWRRSTGSVRDIELADRTVAIFVRREVAMEALAMPLPQGATKKLVGWWGDE